VSNCHVFVFINRINALEDQLQQQHETTGEKVREESRKHKSALVSCVTNFLKI
jgi:hypothetical protein